MLTSFNSFLLSSVKIIVGETSGNSQVLAELSNGDFFGEMALLEDEVRSAAAIATDHSRLLGFFRSDLQILIERKPALGNKILQNLSKVVCTRLRKTNELLIQAQSDK